MNIVKQDRPVSTKVKIGGKEYVVKVNIESPQAESLDALTSFCGSADNHLSLGNSALATNAKNMARVTLRDLPDSSFVLKKDAEGNAYADVTDDGRATVQSAAREYSYSSERSRGPSQKTRAAAADKIAAAVSSGKETFTREELLAMFAEAQP